MTPGPKPEPKGALALLYEIDEEVITPLQAAVVFLSGKHMGDAENAAVELAGLRSENARLRALSERLEGERNALEAKLESIERNLNGALTVLHGKPKKLETVSQSEADQKALTA